jgi:hypothetical protein
VQRPGNFKQSVGLCPERRNRMYFALLLPQLPPVREPHHCHVAPSTLTAQTPAKPLPRWWAAISAQLRPTAHSACAGVDSTHAASRQRALLLTALDLAERYNSDLQKPRAIRRVHSNRNSQCDTNP